MVILFDPSLSLNSYPNCLAALTRANSSGDDELYEFVFLSIIMVWHKAKINIYLSNASLSFISKCTFSPYLKFSFIVLIGISELRWSFNLLSLKFTLSSCFSVAYFPVPYIWLPAVIFLNSIILLVKVPVLSENTYSIWPSSSLRLLAWAYI